MFEKEAVEKGKYYDWNCNIDNTQAERIWKDGAEFGYNKANEWHFVKDGDLPPEDTKVLALMVGGEVCIAHFYRKNVWDKIGIVYAWKEIVPPKEIE